jgi:hypothetical protein
MLSMENLTPTNSTPQKSFPSSEESTPSKPTEFNSKKCKSSDNGWNDKNTKLAIAWMIRGNSNLVKF